MVRPRISAFMLRFRCLGLIENDSRTLSRVRKEKTHRLSSTDRPARLCASVSRTIIRSKIAQYWTEPPPTQGEFKPKVVNVQVVANGKQTAVRACDAARRNRKSFKKMTITKTLGEGSANIPAL